MKLKWLKRAGMHLEAIYTYLARENERAAVEMYNKLIDAADTLLIFPEAGKIEPLLRGKPKVYRSLVACRHYKLVYRIEKETIKIVAVWDCRRSPDKLKKMI